MRRVQFVVAGRHPLLLLTRDHLIRSGFELTSLDGVRSSKSVFVLFGAEVYDRDGHHKVCADLPVLEHDYPTLVLSSSSVYGDRDYGLDLRPVSPMDEAHGSVITSPLDPSAVRPLTALTVEHFCVQRTGRTVIARPFNIYGPNIKQGVVHSFIESCINKRPLTVHAPGRQLRTFLYEDDYLRAVDGLLAKLLKGGRGIYNIGSDEQVEILSLAKSVCHAFDTNASIELVESTDRHVWWKLPALDRIKADAKFKPSLSLRSGLFQLASIRNVVRVNAVTLDRIASLVQKPGPPGERLKTAARRYVRDQHK